MSAINSNDSVTTQLLKRNLALLSNKKILIAGALEDDFAVQVAEIGSDTQLFCLDYRLYCHYQKKSNSRLKSYFSAQFSGEKAEVLLLYMPKSKAEAQYLLANLIPHIVEGGQILLVGENRGGINSAPKLLKEYSERVVKVDAARRCSLYSALITKAVKDFIFEHWFKSFDIKINGQELKVHSLPGVFSYGRLDEATELLLTHWAKSSRQQFSGRLLDFGCGAGVIASYIAKTNENVQAELIDINALSLASSEATLKANNLSAKVYASNVYSDVKGRFSHIVSNPPFHAGLSTHYSSTETFLEKSKDYLEDKGELTIVANSFLKYQAFIDKALPQCEVLSPNNKFKIYHAKNIK